MWKRNNNSRFFCIAFRRFTLQRFWNAIQVLSAYYLSLIIRKPINWGIPVVFSIELSSICNLHCPECLCGTNKIIRGNTFFDLELFKKIIHQIHHKAWIINLYFQGEPLLHPNIIEMIKICNNVRLMTVVSTNGNIIDKPLANHLITSGLDVLIVSVDGWNQKTYEIYRKGGNYTKLIQGMNFLADAKQKNHSKSPSFIAQCLNTSITEKHTEEIKKIANTFGFDFHLKSLQIYNQTDIHTLLSSSNSRYKMVDGKIQSKRKVKNHCRRLWTHTVITSDADITACCNDKSPDYIFESVTNTDISTLFKSKAKIDFQKKVLTKQSDILICRNCHLN